MLEVGKFYSIKLYFNKAVFKSQCYNKGKKMAQQELTINFIWLKICVASFWLSSMRKELEEFWLKVTGVFLIMGNYEDCVFRTSEECGMCRTTHKNKEQWLDPVGSLPNPIFCFWEWFGRKAMATTLHDIVLKVKNMTPISPNSFS